MNLLKHAKKDETFLPTDSLVSTFLLIVLLGLIKTVNVVVCQCQPVLVTLARYHLWPDDPLSPKTVYSTQFLHQANSLMLECHLPLSSFLRACRWHNDLQQHDVSWP